MPSIDVGNYLLRPKYVGGHVRRRRDAGIAVIIASLDLRVADCKYMHEATCLIQSASQPLLRRSDLMVQPCVYGALRSLFNLPNQFTVARCRGLEQLGWPLPFLHQHRVYGLPSSTLGSQSWAALIQQCYQTSVAPSALSLSSPSRLTDDQVRMLN